MDPPPHAGAEGRGRANETRKSGDGARPGKTRRRAPRKKTKKLLLYCSSVLTISTIFFAVNRPSALRAGFVGSFPIMMIVGKACTCS